MKHVALHHQIGQLRQQSSIKTLEAATIVGLGYFVHTTLPNVLFNYMYKNAEVTLEIQRQAQSIALGISTTALVLAIGYFIFAMLGNIWREISARKLEKEAEAMMMMDMECMCGGACGDCCQDDWQEVTKSMTSEMTDDTHAFAKKMSKAKKNTKKK